MPCQSEYPGEELARLSDKLDTVTRIACELAREFRQICDLEKYDWKDRVSKETRIWIKKHDEADAQRLAAKKAQRKREKLRKRAWAKLSPEERDAISEVLR